MGPLNEAMDQPHTASAFGVLCAATPSGCSSAPDLAAPGGGGMELSDAAAVHEGPEDDVSALTHDGRDAPWGRAVWTDRREIGGGAARKHAMTGFAAADATPVVSSHCNPPELYSGPPACRCMGSARANRSGWLPESVWKE